MPEIHTVVCKKKPQAKKSHILYRKQFNKTKKNAYVACKTF